MKTIVLMYVNTQTERHVHTYIYTKSKSKPKNLIKYIAWHNYSNYNLANQKTV